MTITIQNHTQIDNNFKDIIFPEAISYGSVGGPAFFTDVNSSYNGYEQRNINWAEPKTQYSVGCNIASDLDVLLSFFRITKGKARGFLFKDWADYSAHSQILQKCPKNSRIYHFIKSYHSDAESSERRIFKPHNIEVNVTVDGHLQNNPFVAREDIGVLEFEAPLPDGAVVKASFQFYVPVRFDSDMLNISVDGYKNHSCNNIKMVELRLRDNCTFESLETF